MPQNASRGRRVGRGPAGRDLHRALARRHKRALWPHNITTSTECLLGSEPSKAWTLQRYGRCSLSSSSLPSVLLPLTGPSTATGSGTSALRRRGTISPVIRCRGRSGPGPRECMDVARPVIRRRILSLARCDAGEAFLWRPRERRPPWSASASLSIHGPCGKAADVTLGPILVKIA